MVQHDVEMLCEHDACSGCAGAAGYEVRAAATPPMDGPGAHDGAIYMVRLGLISRYAKTDSAAHPSMRGVGHYTELGGIVFLTGGASSPGH